MENLNKERYNKNREIKLDYVKKVSTAFTKAEIVCITTYPPKECGIATYSQDLIKAIHNKFENSFTISICALENEEPSLPYTDEVKYILNTNCLLAYQGLVRIINNDENIKLVVIQHEFGLFKNSEDDFTLFLQKLVKPIVLCFHTVLPNPNNLLKINVKNIVSYAQSVIVMTQTSANLLKQDYAVDANKIQVIAHGTHLISYGNKGVLKQKYNFTNKKILSTFGLLGEGKCIETTLDALSEIVAVENSILFLVLGKTHPAIFKKEGEKYRRFLEQKVVALQLQNHVKFVNNYLPLETLLDYLQMTDVYLFTSKDPNQAVSGTFSYALSCGCAIVSTPIPHAVEVLKNNTGVLVDFQNPQQLTKEVNTLLNNESLRNQISLNGIHAISVTAWENTAIAHMLLFEKVIGGSLFLRYKTSPINLKHLDKLTTNFGIIQFAKINHPDIESGYTLDDNARALVATCQYIELYKKKNYIKNVSIYLEFIKYCFQQNGEFLNYVNQDKIFTQQNKETNLEDSNGRAIWALGYLISLKEYLPNYVISEAIVLFDKAVLNLANLHSTRAMAFAIKGLYYANLAHKKTYNYAMLKKLSNRLVQMYLHESEKEWQWFESYLTYGNSILPEALLCAYLATNDLTYKNIAIASFEFLLGKTFTENRIKVISNKGWLQKGYNKNTIIVGGEQPIDVAYTIMALEKFYNSIGSEKYYDKMQIAFSWFLGNNHLQQIIYNPSTGGCYDGLEEEYVNLNQGAESTVSYLMARLTIQRTKWERIFSKVQASNTYQVSNEAISEEVL